MIQSLNSDTRGRKPWLIKVVSLSIIFFFLSTQLDLQLAFASLAPVPLPAPKSDHIHYMNDFQNIVNKETDDPSAQTSADHANQNPVQQKLAKQPVDNTSFLNDMNPLSDSHDGQAPVVTSAQSEKNQSIVTWQYSDGTYFKFNDSDKHILEIGDKKTNSEFPDLIEVRKFDYESDPSGKEVFFSPF